MNVTSGFVIHEFTRSLKLPIINTPSPDSILPYITPVFLVNDKYFLYFFDNSLYISSESQLINDSWYYILFDNAYTMIILWVITIITTITMIITYRRKHLSNLNI